MSRNWVNLATQERRDTLAWYAIGDIHGCFATLQRLLSQIGFDRRSDRLWLTGDLVNRGPASAEVIRWAQDHEESVFPVLGNHDLHLLSRSRGLRGPKRRDSFTDVLDASDRDDLLGWLLKVPLMRREDPFALVHAGVHPAWSLEEAESWARRVEEALRGPESDLVLEGWNDEDRVWNPTLPAPDATRSALRVLSSIRRCTRGGRLCPGDDPDEGDGHPWFALRPPDEPTTLVFGHWARLGHRRTPSAVALDTGCVWGGCLTALDLHSGAIFQESLADPIPPQVLS